MDIQICKGVAIPESELQFTTSRSGGPGGQHVNKVNSRVTLHFNVQQATRLSSQQKRQIKACLGARMNNEGILRLHSQKYRSQSANRHELFDRFKTLLEKAVKPRLPRVTTKISKSVKEKRLQEKKRRGQLKRIRSFHRVED